MSHLRLVTLTALALAAFAGNSLLCRGGLKNTHIDAASFTTIRLVSGAATLWLVVQITRRTAAGKGNWISALALFAYASAFSFAYTILPAATGALLLFGAVQATMIGYALWSGERLSGPQVAGLTVALGGLAGLLFPGLTAPPFLGSLLMLSAGAAWGVYSLRGRRAGDPTKVTAGNFLRAVPFTAAMSLLFFYRSSLDSPGFWHAVASGALASAMGYVIWYRVLPELKAASAAALQLSVPVIAAAGSVLFLGESVTPRLALASVAILGGIALVIIWKPQGRDRPQKPMVNQRPS